MSHPARHSTAALPAALREWDDLRPRVELPGMDKEQTTVEVSDGELDVHGEVRHKERTGAVGRQTRHRRVEITG
ncbi:Hsp20/alpha crystallin family protein [Streptomyces scabiei]|uniref:Hsp20/alpha crystallin family protein n=1 Tax=Streptomyces scabiei TaxID=1930 RepID=UPI0038F65BEC